MRVLNTESSDVAIEKCWGNSSVMGEVAVICLVLGIPQVLCALIQQIEITNLSKLQFL